MNDSSKKDQDGLEPKIQDQLGEKLKEVYADVVNEPVPDRFLDLLNQLEQSQAKKK